MPDSYDSFLLRRFYMHHGCQAIALALSVQQLGFLGICFLKPR
jgi:hypothetical protein